MKNLEMKKLLLLAASLGMLVPAVMAQIPESTHEKRWWIAPRVIERLGLTDEQQQEIEAIVEAATLETIDFEAMRKKAELRVSRLLDANELDENAVRQAVEQITEARCGILRAEMASRYEIALLLDFKQRRELKKLFFRSKRLSELGGRRRPNRPAPRP